MRKDVTVQEMQEHFAERLEDVRRGVTLRVIDGDQTVAEIWPPAFESNTPEDMIWRRARGRFCDFIPPPPIEADVDVVALIREDRDAR